MRTREYVGDSGCFQTLYLVPIGLNLLWAFFLFIFLEKFMVISYDELVKRVEGVNAHDEAAQNLRMVGRCTIDG